MDHDVSIDNNASTIANSTTYSAVLNIQIPTTTGMNSTKLIEISGINLDIGWGGTIKETIGGLPVALYQDSKSGLVYLEAEGQSLARTISAGNYQIHFPFK